MQCREVVCSFLGLFFPETPECTLWDVLKAHVDARSHSLFLSSAGGPPARRRVAKCTLLGFLVVACIYPRAPFSTTHTKVICVVFSSDMRVFLSHKVFSRFLYL